MEYAAGAYALIWVVFVGYIAYLGRRTAKLERDVAGIMKKNG